MRLTLAFARIVCITSFHEMARRGTNSLIDCFSQPPEHLLSSRLSIPCPSFTESIRSREESNAFSDANVRGNHVPSPKLNTIHQPQHSHLDIPQPLQLT